MNKSSKKNLLPTSIYIPVWKFWDTLCVLKQCKQMHQKFSWVMEILTCWYKTNLILSKKWIGSKKNCCILKTDILAYLINKWYKKPFSEIMVVFGTRIGKWQSRPKVRTNMLKSVQLLRVSFFRSDILSKLVL